MVSGDENSAIAQLTKTVAILESPIKCHHSRQLDQTAERLFLYSNILLLLLLQDVNLVEDFDRVYFLVVAKVCPVDTARGTSDGLRSARSLSFVGVSFLALTRCTLFPIGQQVPGLNHCRI